MQDVDGLVQERRNSSALAMELRFPCINPSIWCIYTWWRHQMETFSALLAICAGNSPVPGNSPHKGQWRGALMFSLICAWISGWVNNREAGDLRRNHAHYDIIVMIKPFGGKSVLWRDCIGLRNLLSKVHSHMVRGICCIFGHDRKFSLVNFDSVLEI